MQLPRAGMIDFREASSGSDFGCLAMAPNMFNTRYFIISLFTVNLTITYSGVINAIGFPTFISFGSCLLFRRISAYT